MQGHKQAYFDIELFGPFQQGIGGTGEEFIEQGPVVGKGGLLFIAILTRVWCVSGLTPE
ncbi:hypothetical protein [Serratia sp. UGAL515B_01]|uniref:hypothetical protein n=1 Tax=Serratia sp. UGAL515B_01 TaxID=2986763 RepID=UPI00398687B4